MAGKVVGRVTTKPAESFVKDGKKFVRTFPVGGEPVVTEVFDSEAFKRERGVSFAEFCDSLVAVPDSEADQVGKVK